MAFLQGIDSTTLLVCGVALVLILIICITAAVLNGKIKKAQLREAEYKKITLQCITAVVNSIDSRDPYSKNHSVRVAEYSVEIARRLGFTDLENLYYIALLHDIGKIGISDDILKRAGRLLPDEYQLMKQHTELGSKMLSGITAIPDIASGAKYHHEHYDGTGYNEGLRGNAIPLVGRIIGIADALDAMTSARSYRRGLNRAEAINELKRCSGTQFDPDIANIMIQMLKEGFTVA
ncbi:MAG: HD-GYP domain-containing protein [Ruminococcaceae bacterium]|nr:HD-GYP domain-containing protein [Oscillospiraceae bacterium]